MTKSTHGTTKYMNVVVGTATTFTIHDDYEAGILVIKLISRLWSDHSKTLNHHKTLSVVTGSQQ